MEETAIVFTQLAVALGLGLLVGLQRQRTESSMAGVRTFPLVTVLGALAAHLSISFGGWVLGAGLVAVAGLAVMANLAAAATAESVDPGLTTEVALLLMYAVGAYLVVGSQAVAVAVAGGLAVLLQLKKPLHRAARRIGDRDFRSIIQFVLISLVILPVLPDRSFGPYGVFNLREIWWMVVLIVGIGMAGYLAYRVLGTGKGTVLTGILGGLISSTATTVSYARYAQSAPSSLRLGSGVILMASSVVFLRVLLELAVVAPKTLSAAGPPLVILLGWMVLLALVEARGRNDSSQELADHGNPSELRSALGFAALYALILLAVATVNEKFGDRALYGVALLSGLTDMDAITLSTGKLMQSGELPFATGFRLILLASLSNLAFKLGIVRLLGGKRLFRRLFRFFALAIALGLALFFFWPS
ncbi:MAG: MgtC/SapB family protein [Deltaproteobacteria bacterium]|nr:MgtC/SapB family protein [Deltaproteobacteria bacterium]